MSRKRRQSRKNPSTGSYLGWALAGVAIYLLYRKSRGLGDPPADQNLVADIPEYHVQKMAEMKKWRTKLSPTDAMYIPPKDLVRTVRLELQAARAFGTTPSEFAATQSAMGPVERENLEALAQQKQREQAYYESMAPRGTVKPQGVEQLLAAEAQKLTGKRSGDVEGAALRQTTTIPQMQFPIPELEPGQFSIDGVPQPKAKGPLTAPATGIPNQYHLLPSQATEDAWAKELERQKTSFFGKVKSFDPFKAVTESAPASDPSKLWDAEKTARGDDTDTEVPASTQPVSAKPLSKETQDILQEMPTGTPSQSVKQAAIKAPSGPSKITYTDEFGRMTTFDPSKAEGIGSKTIASGVKSEAQAGYEARTAMKAMAPQRLTPEEARNRSLQPIPSWQLDFSVGDDPSESKQRAADSAAQKLAQDTGKKASDLAGKYRKDAGIKPVDGQGRITSEGKALIALEGMPSDARSKYAGSKAELSKLTAKKDELENERQWNSEEVARKDASGKLSPVEKLSFEARNKEIDRELGKVRSQMEKPARVVNDIEKVASNLYSGAEKKVKEEAVRSVATSGAASGNEGIPLPGQRQPTPAPAPTAKAAEVTQTKTFDPGAKSFEQESKAFTPAISPFDQSGEARRAAFQQQLQQAAAAASRGGFIQQQMDKVSQMTAAASGAKPTQQPASGWWQQVSALPQQMRTPSYTVVRKKTPAAPPTSVASGSSYSDDSMNQPSIQRMMKSGGSSKSSGSSVASSSSSGGGSLASRVTGSPMSAKTVRSVYAALSGLFEIETV